MKYRFILEDLENETKTEFRTLKEVSLHLDIEYHQARTLQFANDKLYLHKKVEELHKRYNLIKI